MQLSTITTVFQSYLFSFQQWERKKVNQEGFYKCTTLFIRRCSHMHTNLEKLVMETVLVTNCTTLTHSLKNNQLPKEAQKITFLHCKGCLCQFKLEEKKNKNQFVPNYPIHLEILNFLDRI